MKRKRILCYGDSNTYGLVPASLNPATGYRERYDESVRWTALLQQYLGQGYHVIEEGLCARTTNLDYPVGACAGDRNGQNFLEPALLTHSPLDWVILFLARILHAVDRKIVVKAL